MVQGLCSGPEMSGTIQRRGCGTNLEEFMDQDTRFVHHRDVERSPILEEREVHELVVKREVVVRRAVIVRDGGDAITWSSSYPGLIFRIRSRAIEVLNIRRGMWECCKVEPGPNVKVELTTTSKCLPFAKDTERLASGGHDRWTQAVVTNEKVVETRKRGESMVRNGKQCHVSI